MAGMVGVSQSAKEFALGGRTVKMTSWVRPRIAVPSGSTHASRSPPASKAASSPARAPLGTWEEKSTSCHSGAPAA